MAVGNRQICPHCNEELQCVLCGGDIAPLIGIEEMPIVMLAFAKYAVHHASDEEEAILTRVAERLGMPSLYGR